jgi:hypothetical protein
LQCRECISPDAPLTGDDYMMAIYGYNPSSLAEIQGDNSNEPDMSFSEMNRRLAAKMDELGIEVQYRQYHNRGKKNGKRTAGDRDTSSADKI